MIRYARTRSRSALVVVAVLAMLAALMAVPVQANSASVDVVASGLFNPRGVDVGPRGAVYVAESGYGGDGPCIPGPDGEEVCLGFTGAVTKIWRGAQTRIAEGMPSLAAVGGFAATGPSDVSLNGRQVLVTIGLGSSSGVRDAELSPSGGGDLGSLVRVNEATGTWDVIADMSLYETIANPDGGIDDSNPNAVMADRRTSVVADAGGNSLLRAATNGVSTLAVFEQRFVEAPPFLGLPPGTLIPMDSVPTSVVEGPDGAYYVGELTGFPFPIGGARVYRVEDGSATVYAEGFTNIMDLAFAPDGTLYVLEIAHNSLLDPEPVGAIVEVATDGTQTVVYEGLFFPGGMDYARGALYVSNCGICPGFGEVLQIVP